MAANDFVLAYQPNLTGMISVKNTDGTNNLNAGDFCKLDTANPLSATNPFICVVRCNANTDTTTFVCIDNILMLKSGRVSAGGPIVRVVAGAAITAGVELMLTTAGQVVAQTAGLKQVGYALTPAAALNDQILMLQSAAKNA